MTITVELVNQGCADLGLLQNRLYLDSGERILILEPSAPAPVAHGLGVSPGESDEATFVLRATGEGRVHLSATRSYEVHLD